MPCRENGDIDMDRGGNREDSGGWVNCAIKNTAREKANDNDIKRTLPTHPKIIWKEDGKRKEVTVEKGPCGKAGKPGSASDHAEDTKSQEGARSARVG